MCMTRSPFGWWIAIYMERLEFGDEPKRDLDRRCLAWENTILVQARTRDVAYRKAIAAARLGDGIEGHNSAGKKGTWRFEGLTELVPIYEKLEHGAEVLWAEHKGRTVRAIRSRVKPKSKLAVFDDRK